MPTENSASHSVHNVSVYNEKPKKKDIFWNIKALENAKVINSVNPGPGFNLLGKDYWPEDTRLFVNENDRNDLKIFFSTHNAYKVWTKKMGINPNSEMGELEFCFNIFQGLICEVFCPPQRTK